MSSPGDLPLAHRALWMTAKPRVRAAVSEHIRARRPVAELFIVISDALSPLGIISREALGPFVVGAAQPQGVVVVALSGVVRRRVLGCLRLDPLLQIPAPTANAFPIVTVPTACNLGFSWSSVVLGTPG